MTSILVLLGRILHWRLLIVVLRLAISLEIAIGSSSMGLSRLGLRHDACTKQWLSYERPRKDNTSIVETTRQAIKGSLEGAQVKRNEDEDESKRKRNEECLAN